jgi:uncharacterized LabA/DUF88 family protein
MLFVDGENFAIRGKQVFDKAGIELRAGAFYLADTFLWAPQTSAWWKPGYLDNAPHQWNPTAQRAYYYTAVQGSTTEMENVRGALRKMGFMPRVFHKAKGKRSKRVDITLATDALSNAHLGNYDIAVLMTGDEDYIPLVQEIQRMGKLVVVAFFASDGSGLSKELTLAADNLTAIDQFFIGQWQSHLARNS